MESSQISSKDKKSSLKFIFYELFFIVNQYRNVKKLTAIIYLIIFFFQIYYMINLIMVKESLEVNSPYKYTHIEMVKNILNNVSYLDNEFSYKLSANESITNNTNKTAYKEYEDIRIEIDAEIKNIKSYILKAEINLNTNSNITKKELLEINPVIIPIINQLHKINETKLYEILNKNLTNLDLNKLMKDPYYFVNDESYFGKFLKLIIFDPITILISGSILIPLFEKEIELFYSLYTISLILIYVITIISIFSIVYLLYCIILKKEIYFKFAQNFLGVIYLLFQWILLIPSMYFLLYPFFGSLTLLLDDIFLANSIKIINVIILVYILVLCIVLSVLNNDSINKYDNSLCRSNTYQEVNMLVVQICLFFLCIFNITISIKIIIISISCLIIAYNLYNLYKNKIFYDEEISKIYGSFLLLYFYMYINGLIVTFTKVYLNDYSFTKISCFIISYIIFGYFYKNLKNKILNKNINEIVNINDIYLYIEILESETIKAINGDLESSSIISGFILNHKNHCIRSDCPLNENELYYPLTDIKVDLKLNENKTFYNNEIILIHMMKEIFICLCEKFFNVGKFHLAYTLFLLYRMGNNKLALVEIEKCMYYTNTIQDEFSFYILKNNINESIINNKNFISQDYSKLNISVLDIMDVIVFDQLCQILQNYMFECSKKKIIFWNIIKGNRIFVEDIYKKGNDYIEKKNQVSQLWKKLILISNQNKKIIELYTNYLENICDDMNNPILESGGNWNNDSFVNKNLDIDHNDVVVNRFNDDVGFIIISLSLGPQIGTIQYYNKQIGKIFNYSPEYLLGKNVNVLMPTMIGNVHDQILTNFVKVAKPNFIGKKNDIYMKDKEQYIKPVSLFVIPMPSYNDKNEALGLIKERSNNSIFMICNEYGILDTFSKELSNLMDNLDLKNISKIEMSLPIFFILPELLQPNSEKKPKFFISDRSDSFFSINAYFDPYLIPILSELDNKLESSKENILSKIKNKESMLKALSYFKTNCPVQYEQRKAGYLEFSNLCNKIIENVKNEDFSHDYFLELKNYIILQESLLNDSSEENNLTNNKVLSQFQLKKNHKKLYNIKITPFRFYSDNKMSDNKLFIIELTIPPSDIDIDNNNKDKALSNEKEEEKNIEENNNSVQADDVGSVSSLVSTNVNSIQNTVNKIREESNSNDFVKSTQVNMFLLMIIFIIFGYLIYYNYRVYNHYTNLDIKFKMIKNIYSTKKFIYDFRTNTQVRQIINAKEIGFFKDLDLPNFNLTNIKEKMMETSLYLLNLEKNMSMLMINLDDKELINIINNNEYLLETGSTVLLNDIIAAIIYNSLMISKPFILESNEKLISLFSSLGINNTVFSYTDNKQDDYYHTNSFISYTNNVVQDSFNESINIILKNIDNTDKNIIFMLHISYAVLTFVSLIIIFFIFIIIKKRYEVNNNILLLLNLIKISEIKEIIQKVNDFIRDLKQINYNLDNKLIQVETQDEFDDVDSENQSVLNDSKLKKDTSIKRNVLFIRKNNIFIGFLLNIFIIFSFVIVFLFLISYYSSYYIEKYNLNIKYAVTLFESFHNNQKIISNINDVFIYNNNIKYDYVNKTSNFFYDNLNKTKYANEEVFKSFSYNKQKFSSKVSNELISIFYNSLCSDELNNNTGIPCNQTDISFSNSNGTFIQYNTVNTNEKDFAYFITKKSILNNGYKSLIDYYTDNIERLIGIYDSSIENQLYLPYVYILRYLEFYIPNFIIFNEMIMINEKLTNMIEEDFYKITKFFFYLIIGISCGFLIIQIIIINLKWKDYVNNIRLEEYMSNKMIAEIPMHIIRQNKGICEHLLDYSNKNS